MNASAMKSPKVVSQAEWLAARKDLLQKEKEFTSTMIAVSRAPYAKLAAYEKRMGWSFQWVSSYGSDFNFACCVSLTPEEMAKKEALASISTGGLACAMAQDGTPTLSQSRVPHDL